MDWYFTSKMTSYISSGGDTESWTPTQDYFTKLMEKLVRGKKKTFFFFFFFFTININFCDQL